MIGSYTTTCQVGPGKRVSSTQIKPIFQPFFPYISFKPSLWILKHLTSSSRSPIFSSFLRLLHPFPPFSVTAPSPIGHSFAIARLVLFFFFSSFLISLFPLFALWPAQSPSSTFSYFSVTMHNPFTTIPSTFFSLCLSFFLLLPSPSTPLPSQPHHVTTVHGQHTIHLLLFFSLLLFLYFFLIFFLFQFFLFPSPLTFLQVLPHKTFR